MPRLKIENVRLELMKSSWILLSEKYQNMYELLEVQCPEGHKVKMSLYQWRNKRKCPVCNKKAGDNKQLVKNSKKNEDVKRVLALDASTTKTGWAIFEESKLINYGKVVAEHKDVTERICYMNQWLDKMIEEWDLDLIVLEDVYQKQNPQTFKILSRLQGVFINSAFLYDIKTELVMPVTWRGGLNVGDKKRAVLKEKAIKFVKKMYNVIVSEDEAEAICMGHYFMTYILKNDFFGWDL